MQSDSSSHAPSDRFGMGVAILDCEQEVVLGGIPDVTFQDGGVGAPGYIDSFLSYFMYLLADSSFATRNIQCMKHYLTFCLDYELEPLPALLDTILLYIACMDSRLKYVL